MMRFYNRRLVERKLRAALAAAQARLRITTKTAAQNSEWGTVFGQAWEEVLQAERDLAAVRGEPHAVPVDFPWEWDVGAPMPHLFRNDYRAFLLFYLRDVDPNWDGTTTSIVSTSSPQPANLCIVEFHRCVSAKLGFPNEDVNVQGHFLHGRGFAGYRAMRVVNSPWMKELQAMSSTQRDYKPDFWKSLNHYIFGFHDSTFECVAQSFSAESRALSFSNAIAEVCQRMAV